MSRSAAGPFSSDDAGKVTEIRDVRIPPIGLAGTLRVPSAAYALVAFVHGSGSSRLSPRNRAVASALNTHGIGTLLSIF
jgi:putative phosphoribosyl transferase